MARPFMVSVSARNLTCPTALRTPSIVENARTAHLDGADGDGQIVGGNFVRLTRH